MGAGVGGIIVVHLIVEGVTRFIHALQIMVRVLRALMGMTEMGVITGTEGVAATVINNQHIHQGPLTRSLSNNSMEVMGDMLAVGILKDGRCKIMVVMDLAVVDLLEVALLLLTLRMHMVGMAGMEPRIIMGIAVVIVTMVDTVLIVDVGIRPEVEEVRHTVPCLVEEAGLGRYIRTVQFRATPLSIHNISSESYSTWI